MNWTDIVMLVLSATLANHLGLVEAVEGVLRHKIPILNCSKCLSFWVVLLCSILSGLPLIASVAVSFLCAYCAVWLELLYGYIDTLYNKLYENIYTKETDVDAGAEGQLPYVRQENENDNQN
jgi:hypothetical protein